MINGRSSVSAPTSFADSVSKCSARRRVHHQKTIERRKSRGESHERGGNNGIWISSVTLELLLRRDTMWIKFCFIEETKRWKHFRKVFLPGSSSICYHRPLNIKLYCSMQEGPQCQTTVLGKVSVNITKLEVVVKLSIIFKNWIYLLTKAIQFSL